MHILVCIVLPSQDARLVVYAVCILYSLWVSKKLRSKFYLFVSSTMCCRTCAVNKQKKKSTGLGFWGSCKSGAAGGENGRSVGLVSVSGSTATHGTVLVGRDPEEHLPPLPRLPRVLLPRSIHALNITVKSFCSCKQLSTDDDRKYLL